jgi:hypothetical protein
MDSRPEFEHELLPTAEELFVGYRMLLANHGQYRIGDGSTTERETFIMDGESLPIPVQQLADSVEFVPAFDDRGEPGGDYLKVIFPPSTKGLVRCVQIWQHDGQYAMEGYDLSQGDEEFEDVGVAELLDDGVERLMRTFDEDSAPTETEVRRVGRVLEDLKLHFGMND